MNNHTIATIIGVAALGLIKTSGSKSKRNINPLKISDLYKLTQEEKSEVIVLDISGDALRFNSLTELPDDVFEGFENLETLYFRWHKSSTIPSSIGNLTNLEKLFLSYGNLTSLPTEIGNLENLTKIHLENNNLSTLPSSFVNLKKLKYLHLNNNNFSKFPECITELSELSTLSISGNPISELPYSFGNLKNLNFLKLEGNRRRSERNIVINPPNIKTLQYWSKNLKPNVFKDIFKNIERTKSQLRRF